MQAGRSAVVIEMPPIGFWIEASLAGVAQIFFLPSALAGATLLLAMSLVDPALALAAWLGSLSGGVVARAMARQAVELRSGLGGFNAALFAALVLARYGSSPLAWTLALCGAVLTQALAETLARHLRAPLFTAPFVLAGWALLLIAPLLGLTVQAAAVLTPLPAWAGVFTGVGQVVFVGEVPAAALCLLGCAIGGGRAAVGLALGALAAVFAGFAFDLPAAWLGSGLAGFSPALAGAALLVSGCGPVAVAAGIFLAFAGTALAAAAGWTVFSAPFLLATWLVLAAPRSRHGARSLVRRNGVAAPAR